MTRRPSKRRYTLPATKRPRFNLPFPTETQLRNSLGLTVAEWEESKARMRSFLPRERVVSPT